MAQSDYTVGVRTKYSKVGVTLGDFIHQFCDHKTDCDKVCSMRPVSEAKQFIKDKKVDVAYSDETKAKMRARGLEIADKLGWRK